MKQMYSREPKPNKKPKRTPEEERRLIDLYAKKGELHCYFCDKLIDELKDDYSTEYGWFYACGDCYNLYGNPDEDMLEEESDSA